MVAQIVRNFSTFVDHGGLLPHSEDPATGLCCEPCYYSLNSCTPFLYNPAPACFCEVFLTLEIFSVGTLYVCFISPVGALWLPHVNIRLFITLVFDEDYKLRTSSVCIFLLLCVAATLVQTLSIFHLKIP